MDVNLLLAAIWAQHPNHGVAFGWLPNKSLVLCPISELGFLRTSTNKKAINAPIENARELLAKFLAERKVERIFDDLNPLDSHPNTSEEVTGYYLADLAAKNALKVATFDRNLKHKAADLVS